MNATSPPGLATLIAMTGLSVVSMTLFLPVLPKMAAAFGADYALMSVAISGYLLATAVMMLAAGPLADRFGRRPVALWVVGIFLVCAFAAARAETIAWFLVFRMGQSTILAVWVVALASIRDTSAPGEAAGRIGLVSAAMAVAPMLGPMVGGALEAAFGWRATLDALWIGGALVFALVWFDFGETSAPATTERSLIADGRALIASPGFWACALCQSFASGFFHVFSTGAPFVGAASFAMTPAEVGVWMAASPAGFLAGSLATSRIASRVSSAGLMILGRLIASVGVCGGLALVLLGFDVAPVVFGAAVFGGMGNGFTMPGANQGAMEAGGRAAGSAAGIIGALSVVVGAVMAQVTAMALTAETGAGALMALCAFCAVIGLVFALAARRFLAPPVAAT